MWIAPPPPPAAPAAAAPGCDSVSRLTAATALQAIAAKDPGSAKGLIDPELPRCPASEPVGRALRVLRATLALGDGDWAGARDVLNGVDRPGGTLGVSASFIALRADGALKDAPAFDAERARLEAAVDARLSATGRRVERFDQGGATVTGYDSPVDQGPFRRRYEFLIQDARPFRYPRTVMLTDDVKADQLSASLAARDPGAQPAAGKTWFVDLYTCTLHVTLKQLPSAAGVPPTYAQARAAVSDYLSKPSPEDSAAPAELKGPCPSAEWLAPGVTR